MAILFDFKCDHCGKVFEAYVKPGTSKQPCSCGKTAHKMLSPVRAKLEGVTGDFPGAAMKWTKEHERAGRVSE